LRVRWADEDKMCPTRGRGEREWAQCKMGNDGHLLLITEGHKKQGNTSYYTIRFSPQLALLQRLI
jgi:hypothetical protein